MKFDISVFFENLFRKSKFCSNLQEKRVLYMKAYVHLWYLAEFFLEWEMFNINVVQKIKTHNLSTVTFFPNVMAFMIYVCVCVCVCVCVWEREREKSLRPDSPQVTKQYAAEKIRFPCQITKARIWTLTHNDQHILLFPAPTATRTCPQPYLICTLPVLS